MLSMCNYTYDSTDDDDDDDNSEYNRVIIVWHPDIHNSAGDTRALLSRRPFVQICNLWPAALTGIFIGFLSPSRLIA